MNSRRLPGLLLLCMVGAALVGPGCKKSETKEEAKIKAAVIAPPVKVSDEERARAKRAVEQIWGDIKPGVVKAHSPTPEEMDFYLDLAALTRFPHRLSGYGSQPQHEGKDVPGSIAAARYVENRLKMMGLDIVVTQGFPVVQPISIEPVIVVDGNEYPILAMRPNVLQAPVTPAKGLTGLTVYAGKGRPQDYGAHLPENGIAVLDMESEKNWLKAFAFGARAVLFIGTDAPVSRTLLHVNIPANLPRFYISPELAEKLELKKRRREVTIRAACKWTRLTGRNVIAVVRGTDAKVPGPKVTPDIPLPRQAIVLAVPLDTLSEVPRLSPGARDAANCAALLRIAAEIRKNPLRRDVILCFFDAECQNHLGARAFYGSLYRRKVTDAQSLEQRAGDMVGEKDFRQALLKFYAAFAKHVVEMQGRSYPDKPDEKIRGLFPQELKEMIGPTRFKAAKTIITEDARARGGVTLQALRPMRIRRRDLKRKAAAAKKAYDDAGGKKVEELKKQIKKIKDEANRSAKQDELDKLETSIAGLKKTWDDRQAPYDKLHKEVEDMVVIDLGWNRIQRDAHKEFVAQDPNERKDALSRFLALVETAVASQHRRIGEVTESQRSLLEAAKLRHAFGDLAAARKKEGIGGDNQLIILHLSLNLGDSIGRWTFVHGEDSQPIGKDLPSLYNRVYRAIRQAYRDLGKPPGFYELAVAQKYPSRQFAPGVFVDSGAIARAFAVRNLAIMTVMDRLPRQGQPADTVKLLNPATIAAQGKALTPFLRSLAANANMPFTQRIAVDARYDELIWAKTSNTGPVVRRVSTGGGMRTEAVSDVVVATVTGHWTTTPIETAPPGFQQAIVASTNANGKYEVGPVCQTTYARPLAFAAIFDDRGLIEYVTSESSLPQGVPSRASVTIFECRLKTIVGYGCDRGTVTTICMRAISTARFVAINSLLCESGNILSLFAPVEADAFKLFNQLGMVMLVNEATEEGYLGKGVSLGDPYDHPIASRVTAHDLFRLNEFRLATLRNVRINLGSLEMLNGAGKDRAEQAKTELKHLAEGQPANADETIDGAMGDLGAAAGYFRKTYTPLVGVMNDLVTAVVLLLLLAMPFAYSLERLLIGTPHIYRQISGFGIFFLITFGILYAVNPAFKIAKTPIIIFLAFAIILLSSLVITIMIRKLQTEIRRMQGLAATVHSADVSRVSTMLAAVNMGISTMRRRPVRTALTATTVVLLTFTILTFASFGTTWGVGETYESPLSGGPARLLVRHPMWNPIAEGYFDTIRGHLAEEADVVPRYWVSPTAAEVQAATEEHRDLTKIGLRADLGGMLVPLSGAMGMATEDLKRQKLERFFQGRVDLLADDGIFLTEEVRNWMALTDDDVGKTKVIFAGHRFTYAGTFAYSFDSQTVLDGSSWLPVNYQSSGVTLPDQQATGTEVTEAAEVLSHQFIAYSPDRVVVISSNRARQMGGLIRALCIYPRDAEKTRGIGQRVATVSGLPVYAGHGGGVYRMRFSSLTKASGWRDLMIPVLLGGMIIFATMLGSVSDREREIYTFSSLGLAPPHIASLFFAEASVYAVVGGMGGYLLGQIIARALGWLSSLGYLSVPTMNYSSTNAIVTIMIVMGTVLLSTVYPAMKASRSANPGIQRSWKIPKPEGNLYDILFPFTVSAYDIVGVASFLQEHFENYSDTSLGVFATTGSEIFRQHDNDMLGIGASMALAPFDLGVNQRFALLSQPSEIEGIDEVRILLYRTSGSHGDWQRSNRVFINDLRRQLLIWRSLTDDIMDKYRQKTLEAWDSLAVKQVTPKSIGVEA